MKRTINYYGVTVKKGKNYDAYTMSLRRVICPSCKKEKYVRGLFLHISSKARGGCSEHAELYLEMMVNTGRVGEALDKLAKWATQAMSRARKLDEICSEARTWATKQ
jgi:hypothetical protein